jgi:hypothetical protein
MRAVGGRRRFLPLSFQHLQYLLMMISAKVDVFSVHDHMENWFEGIRMGIACPDSTRIDVPQPHPTNIATNRRFPLFLRPHVEKPV